MVERRRRHRGLDRPAGHRRVVLEAPLPGLDRGLQDGRAADPGVRPGRAARVPGLARTRCWTSCPATTWSTPSSPSAPPTPSRASRRTTTSAPGARNPLNFNEACTPTSATTSLAHPLERTAKPGSRCRSGSSPGRPRSSGCCPPPSGPTTWPSGWSARPRARTGPGEFARDLDRFRGRLNFFRRYHSLYNEYAQSELHFVDDHTLALTQSLDPQDQRAFAFDTAVFDWKTYIEDVHCPSVTAPVRRMDALRQQAGQPADHDEGPEQGHRRGQGGRGLRSRRHDHVDQRGRAVPVGPAAGAERRRPSWPRWPR